MSSAVNPSPAPHGSVRICLVEDELTIFELLEAGLKSLGYEVVGARTGDDAMLLIESSIHECHVLICDIGLPSKNCAIDGWTLSYQARELMPELPIIYMSGNSSPLWSSMGVCGSLILTKPFKFSKLTDTLAALLAAGG